MVSIAGINIDIQNSKHGPEVIIYSSFGGSTVTVLEFERFLHEAQLLARSARSKMSARARYSKLPMR